MVTNVVQGRLPRKHRANHLQGRYQKTCRQSRRCHWLLPGGSCHQPEVKRDALSSGRVTPGMHALLAFHGGAACVHRHGW